MSLSRKLVYILCLIMLVISNVRGQTSVRIHAHNDYLQKRPLFEALEAECASIEIDVILRSDTLFVAHEEESIDRRHTFGNMYLSPLVVYLETHQLSRPTALLIDVKTSGPTTLAAVLRALERFPRLLDAQRGGSLRFIISGNRPDPNMYASYPGIIDFDYQSLSSIPDEALMRVAMISLPFKKFSNWVGVKPLKKRHRRKLKRAIDFSRRVGKPIRFWGTPDTPLAWETLQKLGVDFINTDRVKECSAFFKAAAKEE